MKPSAEIRHVTRLKQWLLDIGLWKAGSVEEFRWAQFRPLFWRTPTNLMHRTYRRIIRELYEGYRQDLGEAYQQGLHDGALQAVDQVRAYHDRDWTPAQKYTH